MDIGEARVAALSVFLSAIIMIAYVDDVVALQCKQKAET